MFIIVLVAIIEEPMISGSDEYIDTLGGEQSYQSASISVMIRICVLLVSSISWKMTHPVLGFLVNRTDVG
jgi:hypothetical protein